LGSVIFAPAPHCHQCQHVAHQQEPCDDPSYPPPHLISCHSFSTSTIAFTCVAFIQRFIQFLHHPLYAIAVVLTGFLLFAGLGSAFSKRLASSRRQRLGVHAAVAGIALLTLVYIVLLGPLFGLLAGWAMPGKILLSILLIAPLAFCMGIPFPLGLGVVGQQAPSLLPWAWAINGCASVISAALATLLAIEFGFGVVLLAALGMYILAALSFSALARGTG